jgi:hypothetical protein
VTELDPAAAAGPSADEDAAPAVDPVAVSATDAPPLPADPVAYDAVRNVHARARGLPTPYIPGGTDPDLGTALREERYYGKLLLGMVLALVLGGFVVGILVALAQVGA